MVLRCVCLDPLCRSVLASLVKSGKAATGEALHGGP